MNEARAGEVGVVRDARDDKQRDEDRDRNNDRAREGVEFRRTENELAENLERKREAEPERRFLFQVGEGVEEEIVHVS